MKTTYKALILLFTGLAALLSLDSCVKNRDGETDFGGLKPIVQIPEGGMANFGNAALTFPGSDASDTAWFHLNYAATNVASKDVTVTIGYDASALAAVNSGLDPTSQYAKFPDSTYKFTTTSVTVKAGQSYSAAVPFIVFPVKIDPTKSYMFPISITAGGGATVSGNFGTIYYHVIGNPIAGTYSWDWTRWNNSTGTGTPTSSSFTGGSNVFSPDNPTQIEVTSGYFQGARYVLSFTNNAGVLSNFQVILNPSDVSSQLTANGITVTEGPTILTADPINHVYKFHYSVFNGSAYRYLIDKYYR
ncbi:DUF1735 domain-containing protein [Puia dinghuensis]|uniref:BT-3987-like N-terminal domain-containing protein n=1 Tax=Puia dinghuensis TaxID=1792502 RepID=A0A8J2UJ20_9BACT|nr:DUF1735 domain-containing protein [Puia dinghuensis]GGB24925.1 hypothetical protein GCM10011511_56080 [Puia dinghuensis]